MRRRSGLDIVLLNAGIGSRLHVRAPKCLTRLDTKGTTILDRQVRILGSIPGASLHAVVGYRKECIQRAHPELRFIENPRYGTTNTARSLLLGLRGLSGRRDVLWVNGDVVFDERIAPLLADSGCSCAAVNRTRCGEEEVKYRTDADGWILEISKTLERPLGEALGMNLVRAADRPVFERCLARCADQDYFEKAMELAIRSGMRFLAVDVSRLPCIEVDFRRDLLRARRRFGGR